MSFKWSIPSLMAARFIYDSDAEKLFNAAEITDVTVKRAVNTLINTFKAIGAWNPCKAIYGFAGDGILQTYESQYKYNWKDPRDLDAAFRLTFTGGIIFSSTGALPNGVDGDANTYFVMNTLANGATSNHLSFYNRTNIDSHFNEQDMGSIWVGGGWRIEASSGDVHQYTSNGEQIFGFAGAGGRTGYLLGSRVSSSDIKLYRNSVDSASNLQGTYSGELENQSTHLFFVPGAPRHGDKEFAFATIGDGIDSTLQANMYLAVQAYQTALGRQV